jgi:creatinine amidohydrolase
MLAWKGRKPYIFLWKKTKVMSTDNSEIYLPELTRDEVKEVANRSVLLVPLATIEQHGPHAPLQTDIDNTQSILMGVAGETNPNPRTLVAPPIWFSPSPFEPALYPFNVRIREDVFKDALNDILESYLRSGFKRIAVVNGHGGGTEWVVPEVVAKLNRKESTLWPDWKIPGDAKVVTFEYFAFLEVFASGEMSEIRKSPPGSDWHAGDIETALQLYLHPELVHMDRAKRGGMYKPAKFAPHDLGRNWFRQYIIAGYYGEAQEGEVEWIGGDPTLATRKLGEDIYNLAVKKISEFVKEFARGI